MIIFRIFIFFFFILSSSTYIIAENKANDCDVLRVKNKLSGIWYPYKPYQYHVFTFDHRSLVGLDVDLFDLISKNLDLLIDYTQTKDFDILAKLKLEHKDFASGISFSEERGKDFYFSRPYRYEVYDIYTLKDNRLPKIFDNWGEFLVNITLANYKLGVVKNYNYGSERINNFISKNDGHIVESYPTDGLAFEAFLRKEIDYLIIDNFVATSLIMEYSSANKISNLDLAMEVPVHFVFNKDTVPLETVFTFNQAIDNTLNKYEYKQILNNYLQPYLFFETVKSDLFDFISLISALLFAISSTIFAAKAGMSFFGCCFLSLLPSFATNYCVDLIENLSANANFKNYSVSYIYLVLVLGVCAILFFTIKAMMNTHEKSNNWKELIKFANILDIVARCHIPLLAVTYISWRLLDPSIFFAPMVSVIPISIGIIIRDAFIREHKHSFLYNSSTYIVNAILSSVFMLVIDILGVQNIIPNTQYFIVIVIIVTILVQFSVKYFTIFKTGS